MDWFEVTTTLDWATARQLAEDALTLRRFRVEWHDDRYAVAERGTKLSAYLLGLFRHHHEIGVHLSRLDDGVAVRFVKQESGFFESGLFGEYVALRMMDRLRVSVVNALRTEGALVSVREG